MSVGCASVGAVPFTFSAQTYLADPLLPSPVLATTGIEDLDHLVGGVREGPVWVVTGPGRSGRTALAVQLGAALARAGSPVRFFLGRDPVQEIAARLTAHAQSERLTDSRSTAPTGGEPWAHWAWDFVPQPERQHTDDWDVLPAGGPCCLVIDDLDLWSGDPVDFLPLVRAHARGRGCAVILTLPTFRLRRNDPAVWQSWVRGADVIAALDNSDEGGLWIEILSHRAGPYGTIAVHNYFERARFENAPYPERARPPVSRVMLEKRDGMDAHDWDLPDRQRLAETCSRALSILRHPDTAGKVLAFYDPARNYAGSTFHQLLPNHPGEIEPSDLLAVTLMNVAVQPAALRRLLEPGDDRTAVVTALRAVPFDARLADADTDTMNAAADFYQGVKDSLRGNKWVTASKICSRKRPSLIPVRDRVVVEELNLPNKDFRASWTQLRGLLRDQEVQAALEETAEATASKAPTLADLPALRLLDTAVWMHRRHIEQPGAAEGADE